MKIVIDSVFVKDQDEALRFYTGVLGFKEKMNFPVGKYKWLTVISPEQPEGPQLLLEPDDHPATVPYEMGPATIAVFDDTCGNLIQIAQFNGEKGE